MGYDNQNYSISAPKLFHQPAGGNRDSANVRVGARQLGHWKLSVLVLDDTFQKDDCHLRTDHTECNMASGHCIVLNFLIGLQQQIRLNMPIHRLREMTVRYHRFTSCSTMTPRSVSASQVSPPGRKTWYQSCLSCNLESVPPIRPL